MEALGPILAFKTHLQFYNRGSSFKASKGFKEPNQVSYIPEKKHHTRPYLPNCCSGCVWVWQRVRSLSRDAHFRVSLSLPRNPSATHLLNQLIRATNKAARTYIRETNQQPLLSPLYLYLLQALLQIYPSKQPTYVKLPILPDERPHARFRA